MNLQLASFMLESITDGLGMRSVVFFQGCDIHCPGCQNPQTHDPKGGLTTTTDDIVQRIMKNPYLDGVTFSGGEPFMQAAAAAEIARKLREKAPSMNVWTFTGHTWDQLQEGIKSGAHPEWQDLLLLTDVLVEGPFIEAQKSLEIKFRGSRNQRLLKLENGQIAGTLD